jgi:sulfate/thiosulfate transport system permease protein
MAAQSNGSGTRLPGLGLALGTTLTWLCLLVLLPLGALAAKGLGISFASFRDTLYDPRVHSALALSLGAAGSAALVNTAFGLVIAWVLVRYRFFGRRVVDALVDLPFALPTAVAGMALTAVYAENGLLGSVLARAGIKVAFAPLGVMVALIFIGLPFVVRTVQPVIQDLDPDAEEAAMTLGASRWCTFRRIILPELAPALLTGFTLAFARGLGEYGSVVFISGNMPLETEIVPLLIVTKLEQYDYAGAIVLALTMLAASLLLLLALNGLARWQRRSATAGGE